MPVIILPLASNHNTQLCNPTSYKLGNSHSISPGYIYNCSINKTFKKLNKKIQLIQTIKKLHPPERQYNFGWTLLRVDQTS